MIEMRVILPDLLEPGPIYQMGDFYHVLMHSSYICVATYGRTTRLILSRRGDPVLRSHSVDMLMV